MTAVTPMQRVLTTLGHREADRVPFFLLATMHGARELGTSIREYFASGERVAEGQLRMREKYGHDCLYGFFYAPVEVEAFGGEVIYREDGPPNSGTPFLRTAAAIRDLVPPRVEEVPCLAKVLDALRRMKAAAGDEVPIIGVVMSPFSLPVMQMGFEAYLDLMHGEPGLFSRLMAVNEEFCVAWANAQLEAGATFICYFDPVSSSTIVPRETYLKTGFAVAKRTLPRFRGPSATHLASGRCLPIVEDLLATGTAALGVSVEEPLSELRAACRGRATIVGNLNGLEMRWWSREEAEQNVRRVLAEAGPGGGFVLSDNHGEIPWQVPEGTLAAVSEAVRRWGRFPLGGSEAHA